MKRITVLASTAILAILFIGLLPSGLSATTTWLTYREDVAINSGTLDIDYIVYDNGTTSETYTNITLPCNVGNLSQTLTQFRIKNENATNTTFNLTVNGETVNSSSEVDWDMGNWSNVTLAMMVTAGVSETDTYLNFTYDVNNSANDIHIRIYADDANITSAWLTNNIVVKEKDLTTPSIKPKSSKSFFTVNDSIQISNALGYTITDINMTKTYPSHIITIPSTYLEITSIANGASSTTYTNYQKYGPYVYDLDDDSSGSSHEVVVYIKSYELLSNCVEWILDVDDEDYDGAFDDMNYNSLDVELNNRDIDWDEGSIEMEDLTIKTSYSNNQFVFIWDETAVTPPITPSEQAWYLMVFFGLALYVWLVVITTILIIVILVALAKKK